MNHTNITLDLSYLSFTQYFGHEKVNTNLFDEVVWFNINGKDIKMRPSHFIEDNSNGWLPSEVRVQVILEPYPCEQIKVAEESVAKAKEALKAAENALKVVKEGK
jgi:hypothetical protein